MPASRRGWSLRHPRDLHIEPAGNDGRISGAAGQVTVRRARTASLPERWWALGLVVAVFLPAAIVLGSTFLWAVPGQATWHAMVKDLQAAWTAFSFRVAPVPELPGLVLATAWAAGAAGLLAELISSKRTIPAVFALTPALGLYLFASALGTDNWRVLGLASMAGSACWYLVAVVRERERAQEVLIASPDTGLSIGDRATSYGAGAVMLRMAVLAALAAAVSRPEPPRCAQRGPGRLAWHHGIEQRDRRIDCGGQPDPGHRDQHARAGRPGGGERSLRRPVHRAHQHAHAGDNRDAGRVQRQQLERDRSGHRDNAGVVLATPRRR